MTDTTSYLSAGWDLCTNCKTKPTNHKSGVCMNCRKALNMKPDKHVLSAKVKNRGRYPRRGDQE